MKINVAFDKAELSKLQQMLDKGGLRIHQRPMQELFEHGSKLLFIAARQRVPFRTGATYASLQDMYGKTGKKPWGTGRVIIETKQGALLEHGGRGKNSIYRSGPRMGRRTRHWMVGALRLASVRRGIDSAARNAVEDMARGWVNG